MASAMLAARSLYTSVTGRRFEVYELQMPVSMSLQIRRDTYIKCVVTACDRLRLI